MNTKTIFTICLLLLGAMALQAQELERFYNDNGKVGYKKNGNIVIAAQYDAADEHFIDGLAAVKLQEKWGFINEKGEVVIPLKYDWIFEFSEGFSAVRIDNKWGFIDQSGKKVIALKYDDAKDFSEGLAFVKLNEKWGVIDKTGKEITAFKYDGARDFINGLAFVQLNGKWGFVDKSGKELTAFKYDEAKDFSEETVAVSERNFVFENRWGFINKTGREIIPLIYAEVGKFSDGFVRVKMKIGNVVYWEYYDSNGIKLGESYDNAKDFSEGLAAVQSSETKKWGFIDKTGREYIPFIFDRIGEGGLFPSEDSQMFKDGKVKVKKDGREFYIDKTGKEIEDDNTVIQKMATAYQSGNFAEAFKLAEQLANKHNADAMNLLGNMYAQGQGTRQNYGMARSWWEMASNKGNAAATGNIGLLYAQGWGVPQNIAEAEKWFKKGAELGDPQSMFNLGNLAFQKGNLTEAKQWIQKAKTAGHPQADAALQQINAASANQQQPRREKN